MLAGIDLGASSLKITLCDPSGRVVVSVHEAVTTSYPRTCMVEQNPADWLRALQDAIVRLGSKRSAITQVAVSAGAHICVLLDKRGKVLRPAIMWNDQRAAMLASELASTNNEQIASITKNKVQATWSLATLAWLRRYQPEVLRKTRRICFAKDYLRMWLCGSINSTDGWVTDRGDAMGSLLADSDSWKWSEELCELAGIDTLLLPKVVSATTLAGELAQTVADQSGLICGISIYTGSIDTSTELLAAGCVKPEDSLLKLATAGVWSKVITTPVAHPHASLYPAAINNWYHASGVNNCAAALEWGANLLWQGEGVGKLDMSLGRTLDGLANNLPEATSLPLFHPYLLGERAPLWNSLLRAGFIGLSQQHGRDQIAWAIAEGILFGLRHARDISKLSIAGEEVMLAGGISSLPNMLRLSASILGQPLRVCRNPDASYGTALLAGVAAGKLDLPLVVNRHDILIEPQTSLLAWFDQRYQLYIERIENLPYAKASTA